MKGVLLLGIALCTLMLIVACNDSKSTKSEKDRPATCEEKCKVYAKIKVKDAPEYWRDNLSKDFYKECMKECK